MIIVDYLVLIFKALAAIPQILKYVQEFAAQIMIWYINNAQNETLKQIADAAAYSAKAKTKEERYEALTRWRVALNKPRVSQG